MKRLATAALVLALGLSGATWGDDGVSQHQPKVIFEPHGGSLCASGCALSRHPTPSLKWESFERMLVDYSQQPMSEESPALEELLYYGPQTVGMLEHADGKLDSERRRFLNQELSRDLVKMEFRIIDESGRVRVSLPPTIVPFDKRFVFEPLLTEDFQPPEASGTVKRVGLNHVWQRI
ncbi:MAG: hypothetical protein KC800_17940 [Candidatus Eremiobacteraeota bacterium]|nr:hypothetical protein [Candidatus Eremiobacteraeota bacterium]